MTKSTALPVRAQNELGLPSQLSTHHGALAVLPPKAHGVASFHAENQKTGLRRPPTFVGHSLARIRHDAEARNDRFELALSSRVLVVAQSHRARVERGHVGPSGNAVIGQEIV